MDVKVYALSTCGYCRMTRQFLDDHKVDYDVVEVDLLEGEDQHKAAEEARQISGGSAFPVITAGQDFVVGFDPEQIAQLLEISA